MNSYKGLKIIISTLTLSEIIQLILEIIVILGILIGIFTLLKPILRLFLMDKLIGDSSIDLDFTKDKKLFWKFYLIDSKRGKLLFYISDINMRLDDGKRITERFFVFRKKDNLSRIK